MVTIWPQIHLGEFGSIPVATDVNHVRLAIHGKYKSIDLSGEEWVFGCDFAARNGPNHEDIWDVVPEFNATYVPKTATGTGYTGEANFLCDGGALENDLDPLDWLEDQVMPAAIAYIGTSGLFPSTVYIDEISAWPIGADGKVSDLPVGAAYAKITATVDTWDGASSNAPVPPFVSYSVSKETLANIPRGRGRFYPPMQVPSSDTSGLISAASRTASANAAKAFLEACQWSGGVSGPSIWPVVIGPPFQVAYAVKGVSVDNIPDTQRRRKKGLPVQRTSASLSF